MNGNEKKIWITGASSGIGNALAIKFATNGWQVAVSARRMHDVNRSGWWQLIPLTIIGIIPYTYWVTKKSDPQDNNFGPNPLPN